METIRLPVPEALESAWATSVNVTEPEPMYPARADALVRVVDWVPLAVRRPKSWPLVPPKSSTPSQAEALNVWVAEMSVTSDGTPGPDRVSVPAIVALTTPPEVDLF